MKNINLIIFVTALILTAGASFFGGMLYGKNSQPPMDFQNGQRYVNRAGNNGQQFAPLRGEILDINGDILTVKLADGSSKIVLLSASTTITESTVAAKTSLTPSKQINVFGTTNSDGTVAAQNVQLGNFNFGGNGRRMAQ